ncbi:MAG TPA: hypothetical protein PLO37_09125 [Candidatus Hydrogenedentes bacterium]|nr:hypothetical protein [Candidatus Hydrogenedentota bacterium]HPG66994.1 hypothetical protein [Candidatus Hydrogenedentota bacterium]
MIFPEFRARLGVALLLVKVVASVWQAEMTPLRPGGDHDDD